MDTPEVLQDLPVHSEDVARWLTFSSFWGSIYYLLAITSQTSAHQRQPLRLDAPTVGLAMAIHVAAFTAGGSATSAIGSLAQNKPTTEQAREAVAGGVLERTVPLQALGGAIGSLIPFALAVGSQQLASQITGRQAIEDPDDVNWPQAMATMVVASGLTALAVTRITAWVARDAKRG